MILFYAEKITPRLKYTSRLVLNQLLGLEVRYCVDKEEFLEAKIPKINYSKEPLQSGIFIQSVNLLFETEIFEQEIKSTQLDDIVLIFLTGKRSRLPFDPFAATFYLVSRYEEYIPYIADEHGRFTATKSLLYRLDSLKTPVVNAYAQILAKELDNTYPNLNFNQPKYSFINSIDIDNASAYLGKGIFRVLGSYARDCFSFNFKELVSRTKTILGMQKDPFETFEYIYSLQEKYGFNTIYFALFGRLGQYDRSLTRYSPRLQRYLKGISDFCEVGIHPSYRSNESFENLEEEHASLERILKKDVTKSRQHFLKLNLPKTYRNLMDLEIKHDYTMGYASKAGFRAGICTPFRFYDLEQEIETPLMVHPFPFMDGTYLYYDKKSPEEALKEIVSFIEVYRKYGGEFIPIWHNRVFSEKEEEWKGWNEVFERMISLAI